MGSDLLIFRAFLFDLDQVPLLSIEGDGLHRATSYHHGCNRSLLSCYDGGSLILLVSVLPFREGGIVEFSASVQDEAELLFSGLVGIEAVFVGLSHLSALLFSTALSPEIRGALPSASSFRLTSQRAF